MSRNRPQALDKFIDAEDTIRCASGSGLVREEAWRDHTGYVRRYNLAFINSHLFAGDNGRVLGYDTAHGYLHRHFAGTIEQLPPTPYESILDRFLREVAELKTRKAL